MGGIKLNVAKNKSNTIFSFVGLLAFNDESRKTKGRKIATSK